MNRSLAFLSLLACGLAPTVTAQKTPDVRLNTDPPPGPLSYHQKMAISGPSIYVAWEDGRHWPGVDIYFNRSLDGGATWLTSDIRINTNPAGSGQLGVSGMAADGQAVYVAFVDGSGAQAQYLNRSLDGGMTWLGSDVQLSSTHSSFAFGGLVAAAGSAVFVAWQEDRNGQWGVYFNRSLDRGSTWLPSPLRIDTANASSWKLLGDLTTDGTTVYVTWTDLNAPPLGGGTYFDRSLDQGASWLASDVRVDTGSAGTGTSRLAVSGTDVFVTWVDSRNGSGDIYFNRSLDRGATWLGTDVRLDTDPAGVAGSGPPRIAAVGSNVYVVWTDYRNGPEDVYFNRSLDRGSSWMSSDLRLDSGPGNYRSRTPQIAASGPGVFVTWNEHRGTVQLSGMRKGFTYFDRSLDGGTTWLSTDVRMDRPNSIYMSVVDSPQIAATGSSVYVTWPCTGRLGGRDYSIYFNIPFGAQPYGTPTAGTNGVAPRLTASGFPAIGQVPTLQVADGLGASPGALLIGFGPGSKIAQPFLGGTLLVAPLVGAPITLDPAGATSFAFPVPNDPSLVGLNLNFQAGIVDSGAPLGVSLTNGLEIWIG